MPGKSEYYRAFRQALIGHGLGWFRMIQEPILGATPRQRRP
jgi:hypothetical protein